MALQHGAVGKRVERQSRRQIGAAQLLSFSHRLISRNRSPSEQGSGEQYTGLPGRPSKFPRRAQPRLFAVEQIADDDGVVVLLVMGGKQQRHRALAQGLLYLVQKRSEEHTSELQSLMRISYAVFCLKKKIKTQP